MFALQLKQGTHEHNVGAKLHKTHQVYHHNTTVILG